ncbi:glycoside hydrolase family 88 protein [Peribacillus loiseleuriae]|uniref:Unsaturated rhamnogalacturonyl hydrolase n=1 Tax=Peribacillus loiseleuriae TaxID=1679170 RepID=A0A0K9GZ60_9BACI|nr:glycoside hydrolase family 88 protein [Peribacillus loiseleuriae]KMY51885.1 hypothetical protein AC625_22085 [Peribacillus loiseleuriae]
MILQTFSYILLSIFVLVSAIDIVPIMRDWTARIKIGRYEDCDLWNKEITKKGLSWLKNTPKIKVTDNTRLVVIDVLKGNYTKSAIQHWQEGSLLLGMTEYLKNNTDENAKKLILEYLDSKFNNEGQWVNKPQNVDGAILAYAVMKLDFIDTNKYKKALDYTWEMIKEHMGEDGTVKYRHSMKNYRYVDTIGFICPFLVCYGVKYEKEECVELAVNQIKSYEKYGMHKEYNIPVHAYNIENKIPLGLYGWGRGLGWFAIGLIDAWNETPFNHKSKLELEKSVIRFAKGVMSFQQNDGSWNWTVTRSESNKDSSTTATLSWFLLNAARLDSISDQCIKGSEKAIHYLMKVTRRNGAVDFSQGDTKDIGIYSTLFNIFPFTQGFCIRSINLFLQKMKKNEIRKVG